jgi:hypothetical protein
MRARTNFGRRSFLRGAGGVVVGLPFLEAFAPRGAHAASPKRFAIFFQCNGVDMDRWWPKVAGSGPLRPEAFAGTALEPIKDYAGKLLIPRGLHMVPRGFSAEDGAGGDDHMKGMGHKLTAAPNSTVKDVFYPTGPSLDYVVAKAINPGAKDPLNLAIGPNFPSVLNNAFYRGDKQPAELVRNPWYAFQELMGAGSKAGMESVELTARRRKSVLDLLDGQRQALERSAALGAEDRRKLDLHFSNVRKIETAVGPGGGAVSCGVSDERAKMLEAAYKPLEGKEKEKLKEITADRLFPVVAELMIDLMTLTLACDANRVVTIQVGRGAGGPVYKWLGDDLNQLYNHHALSHGNTDGGFGGVTLDKLKYKESLFNIDKWHMAMFKRLLDNLSAYKEADGSVLDNSAVLYINELSDGLGHDYRDLPAMIAGSAGGYLKQGQYVRVTKNADPRKVSDKLLDAPHNQLLTTIANAVGYKDAGGRPMEKFGTATGAKPGEILELKA